MREIKFRKWDGYEMQYEPVISMIPTASINEWFDTDDIVMQYTGLKDKNGKEIYEGDIIEIQAWHIDKHEGYEKIDLFYRASVVWGMAEWCVSDNDTLFNNSQELFEGENVLDILEAAWDSGNYGEGEKGISNFLVVGNIYENPELITPTN